MVRLELYDKTKTYIFGTGRLATPEVVAAEYPATQVTRCVITTDESGETFGAIEILSAMVSRLNIDPSLSPEEIIAIAEGLANSIPEQVPPDASERIAAAMEFQNLMML